MKLPVIRTKNLNTPRILRTLLAIATLTAYACTTESFFLISGLFFGIQALFNIGCPGGTCDTGRRQKDHTQMTFKKYEPEK